MADRQENKKTVVVVDDEPIIRMDLGQMLEELNYEVVAEGADGFDAVELCRKKNPDVVLLDLEMPVFDGMTAAETIINENLAGCVVICTAFADEDFLEQAGRIGVSGYIVKPVEARNLRPTIEMAYAQGRRLAKQKLAIGEANRRLEENRVIKTYLGNGCVPENAEDSHGKACTVSFRGPCDHPRGIPEGRGKSGEEVADEGAPDDGAGGVPLPRKGSGKGRAYGFRLCKAAPGRGGVA